MLASRCPEVKRLGQRRYSRLQLSQFAHINVGPTELSWRSMQTVPSNNRLTFIAGPPKLRILFVGNLNPYARTLARARAFANLGAELLTVNTAPRGNDATGDEFRSPYRRFIQRLGYGLDVTNAGAIMADVCTRETIDLIWVEKGNTLSPSHLKRVKDLRPSTPIIWFSEDDMALPHNQSVFFRDGLKFYDHVFTTKSRPDSIKDLRTLGAKTVHFVHQSYDETQHYPMSADNTLVMRTDIGFIGSYETERAKSMLAIAKAGHVVNVWGGSWEKCRIEHPRLKIHRQPLVNVPPHSLRYSEGISTTKINLCFLRKINHDQHTSRSFEIPAIGGFMLAERTPEHCSLYCDGQESAFFSNDEELVSKIEYYLSNEDERKAVAIRGHNRCVPAYSSTAQMRSMLAKIWTSRIKYGTTH